MRADPQSINNLQRYWFCIPVLQFLILGFCRAREPDNSISTTTNVRVIKYPKIIKDLRVIFKIAGSEAKKVQIQLDKQYDLLRDEKGNWNVTTGPQVPGFHYYTLIIDGALIADPASESFFGMSRMAGGYEIPEKGIDFYLSEDVPHSDIRSKICFSKITRKFGQIFIHRHIQRSFYASGH